MEQLRDQDWWASLDALPVYRAPRPQFRLLDEEVNLSPFPDSVWREFAFEYNREQRELQQIFDLLMEGIPV
jgi:hypothetical protein